MSQHDLLRRGQLIAPFGIGAIHVLKGAKTVVTAGLDYWFCDCMGEQANPYQLQCVKVNEPRLENKLGVSHFRQPPGPESNIPDAPQLTVPLFRFPTWFICPRCNVMVHASLHADGNLQCKKAGCGNESLRQISFAAACEGGHLQDFPWREWVHREEHPMCLGELQYRAGGSGTLADIVIECLECKKKRNLLGVMSGALADPSTGKKAYSGLSSMLLSKSNKGDGQHQGERPAGQAFNCQGGRVWLGEPKGEMCVNPLRAILINSTNGHYSQIASALWIPPGGLSGDVRVLLEQFSEVRVRANIRIRKSLGDPDDRIVEDLKRQFPEFFANTDSELLKLALSIHCGEAEIPDEAVPEDMDKDDGLRLPEYNQLAKTHNPSNGNEHLSVRPAAVDELPDWLSSKISCVSLVERLRETRAFYGFSRLMSQRPVDGPQYQDLLWKHKPVQKADRWLPASVVYGEGIFIRFNEGSLRTWEKLPSLGSYLQDLQERFDNAAKSAGWTSSVVSLRLVMLHTLAHLLIRRLTFECGYGSASLRERLYVSTHGLYPMAGMLIYTASGDCEGSMGGLVRMGEAHHLARIFSGALDHARWCSADPVCSESGQNGGQGINGLNLAACHCCGLLPETSCEQYNRFLDRNLVTDFFNHNNDLEHGS